MDKINDKNFKMNLIRDDISISLFLENKHTKIKMHIFKKHITYINIFNKKKKQGRNYRNFISNISSSKNKDAALYLVPNKYRNILESYYMMVILD